MKANTKRETRLDVPYGTLDLLILRALESIGQQHGYGIARRIEQVAEGSLSLNQGTIYPALLRLEQKRWIKLEMLVETYMADGMPAQEARMAARRELGGMEQIKERIAISVDLR